MYTFIYRLLQCTPNRSASIYSARDLEKEISLERTKRGTCSPVNKVDRALPSALLGGLVSSSVSQSVSQSISQSVSQSVGQSVSQLPFNASELVYLPLSQ